MNMKFIGYNILPLAFIALAAVFVIYGHDGWGWCILAALLVAVVPTSKNAKTADEDED